MSSTLRFSIIAVLMTTVLALGLIVVNLARPTAMPILAQNPPPLTSGYLVAARTLPAGTLARDEDVAVRTAPVSEIPKGAITDTPDARSGLRGSLIRDYLEPGTPIRADDVLRPRDRGFIASVLQAGHRAVSIGVDPVSGVAGLIWPGDHVDLILIQTMGDKEPLGERTLSETILTDIRVIAIDQEMVQAASSNNTAAGKLARTVTLEVDPEQAQKVAVAATMGKLSLAIRPAVGNAPMERPAPTFGADVSTALQKPLGTTVTVFNGVASKEVTFK
jgi:pilus assembly protein CpaB